MKLMHWFFALFLILITTILVGQFNYVKAVSPSPLTSPISSPISYFTYQIKGNITYRLIDNLKNVGIVQASNVSVELTDNITNQKTLTTTDALGNYKFSNLKPGPYTIRPYDNKSTKFNPISRTVQLSTGGKDATGIDFSGDLVPQVQPSASFTPDKATFNFPTNGSSSYRIDLSTYKDMSWDVYLSFGTGSTNPIIVNKPQDRWAKYSCGQTLYWRVISNSGQILTPIQATKVECPPGYQTVGGTFSNLYTTQSGPSVGVPVPANIGFGFNYSYTSSSYQVDVSTTPDMSWDVYLNFVSGSSNSLSVINPQARWAKFSCGQTLYWRVYNFNRTVVSPIASFTVVCPKPVVTPTPIATVKPTTTPKPSPVVTPKPSSSPVAISTSKPSQTPVATVKPVATPTPKVVVLAQPVKPSPISNLINTLLSLFRLK